MVMRIKLLVKHLLGKDIYLSPTRKTKTCAYGSKYGGWALPLNSVSRDSIVYSFGIGEDASFDLALIEATGCEVYGFDPTPKSLAWVRAHVNEPRFQIRPWALGVTDGQLELWLPKNPEHVSASCRPSQHLSQESIIAQCMGLGSIMQYLQHDHVDVLKMDIEGSEYEVLVSLLGSDLIKKIGLLLVEFHHWMPSFGKDDTLEAIRSLRNSGLEILWVSESGHELLFGR